MTASALGSIPMRPEVDRDLIRLLHPFASGRTAFAMFLRALQLRSEDVVLLPSYIGVSHREGSGVFDPIRETGVGHAFYRMDATLSVDLNDLARQLERVRPKVVVLIHFFGWPDPSCPDVVRLAHDHGALVMEDSAHAMLSDVIGAGVGRLGDASIWSLHKLLPMPSGGMLVLNAPTHHLVNALPAEPSAPLADPWRFDLAEMAARRREKAVHLLQSVRSISDEIEPLRQSLPPGVVPQTFPVLVRRASRDRLYETLNAAGFGVVSLYHTLIDEIASDDFPESHALSHRILNLPLHESASVPGLDHLVRTLGEHAAGQGARGAG